MASGGGSDTFGPLKSGLESLKDYVNNGNSDSAQFKTDIVSQIDCLMTQIVNSNHYYHSCPKGI